MQKRAVRLTLLALLVIAGFGAGLFIWDTQRRADRLLESERELDARTDRVAAQVTALGEAQQAAVVRGQSQAEWLSRVSALVQQIHDDVAALQPRSRSQEAAAMFARFRQALDAAVATDARARVHLQMGQELMAADLVFSEGRPSIDAMSAALGELEAIERTVADGERQAMQARAATILGGATLLWLVGLVVLARTPAAEVARREIIAPPIAEANSQGGTAPASTSSAINLTDAAEICTALSRLTSASALPPLLERAAHVLDASGIIVWLGAGEELFPVTSYGYDSRVLARLGPISRNAENATAAAWRTASIRTVAGDATGNGAVVAPLFAADGCIGAFAAEVRHGRETDERTQAVTAIFGAQLAAAVAAWPPASAGTEPARQESPRAAHDGSSAATA